MMLSALLEDPSVLVRRALAEAVAHSLDAPRHVIAALAHDQSAVSVPVLLSSPLLTDADLVDAVAIGDAAAQIAVASRPSVHAPVSAALAEVGHHDAIIVLCGNDNAAIPVCATRRMVERFGDDGTVREAILARGDLEPALRHDLVVATARALTAFAIACDWMSPERADRVSREARDKAVVTIASRSARDDGAEGPRRLVAHLRSIGHLTPALILRSLLSGNIALFEATMSELSGIAPAQIGGHVRTPSGLAFASLYAKAGMPAVLLPVFRAALRNLSDFRSVEDGDVSGALMRPMINGLLDLCSQTDNPELCKVAALLRRFEAEAVREEIRAASVTPTALDRDEENPNVPDMKPWMIGPASYLPRLHLRAAA
jgi:uncharacterized protein (DUF2336 family)